MSTDVFTNIFLVAVPLTAEMNPLLITVVLSKVAVITTPANASAGVTVVLLNVMPLGGVKRISLVKLAPPIVNVLVRFKLSKKNENTFDVTDCVAISSAKVKSATAHKAPVDDLKVR